MVRIALALTAAICALAVAAPAAGAKTQATLFKITRAQGTVAVTFAGDQAAGCAARGVCGVSGTSTYTFGGKPKFGVIYMFRTRGRTRYVFGYLNTRGETVSDVATAGSPERCIDRVAHASESLSFEPHRDNLEFYWRELPDPDEEHGEELILLEDYGGDPFDTRCAGPALRDMAESDALPEADIPYRPFRQGRGNFGTSGTHAFAGGGFAGTVTWNLRYGIQRLKRGQQGDAFAIAEGR